MWFFMWTDRYTHGHADTKSLTLVGESIDSYATRDYSSYWTNSGLSRVIASVFYDIWFSSSAQQELNSLNNSGFKTSQSPKLTHSHTIDYIATSPRNTLNVTKINQSTEFLPISVRWFCCINEKLTPFWVRTAYVYISYKVKSISNNSQLYGFSIISNIRFHKWDRGLRLIKASNI